MITFETQEDFEKAVIEVMLNTLSIHTNSSCWGEGQEVSLRLCGEKISSDSIEGCRCGDTY